MRPFSPPASISKRYLKKAAMEQMTLSVSGKTMSRCSHWPVDMIYLTIFFMSFAVRLVKLVFDPLLLRDGALYLRLAETWYKTGDYLEITKQESRIPPLPLWCIKTLMNFTGDSEIAGRAISIFLGGVIPVIGFIAARKITHHIRISLIAALCFVLHPNLVSYSIQPLRENYFIILIGLLLIVVIQNFRNTRTAGWIVCGTLIGIAFFCRLEAVEFLIIVAIEIAFLKLRKNNTLSFIKTIGIFLLAFILTSLSLFSFTDGDFFFIKRAQLYSYRFILELSNTTHL